MRESQREGEQRREERDREAKREREERSKEREKREKEREREKQREIEKREGVVFELEYQLTSGKDSVQLLTCFTTLFQISPAETGRRRRKRN